MTIRLALVSILLLADICLSQPSKPLCINANELSSAVVYLYREQKEVVTMHGVQYEVWLKKPSDTVSIPKVATFSGTATLLADGDHLYLVTASHVAAAMNPSSVAVLRGPSDMPIKLSIKDLSGTANPQWTHHKHADVAVLRLSPSPATITSYLQGRFLPREILCDTLRAPSRELPLTVVGFPLGLGTEGYFSPLTLQTKASSGLLQLDRFDTGKPATFFICENPSIGGYSGAPCFDVSIYVLGAMTTTGSGTKCYGLMHGTLSDQTGGKLAAIVPSSFVVELIK